MRAPPPPSEDSQISYHKYICTTGWRVHWANIFFGIQWWIELTKLAPNSFNYIISRSQKWIRLLCNHTQYSSTESKFQPVHFQSTSKFIHRIGNITQHYYFLCFPPLLLDVHVNVHDLHTLTLKPTQRMSISHPSD